MSQTPPTDPFQRLPFGSLRVATSAERRRAEVAGGRAGWRDRSSLELSGTPEALETLAELLRAAAAQQRAAAGVARVVLDPARQPAIATREWSQVAVNCVPSASDEAAPAVRVDVIERSSDAHRRDKLVVEVQNLLASTIRVTGYRFEAGARASAGNADLLIHGGRAGRFTMFVPADTAELALWVDGFTDLAGGGAPWTIGRRERHVRLPERASRTPLEDRIM